MLFNSTEFLIFFPIVVAIFFATPHRWRWIPLLIASYYFYMSWKPEYVVLLAGATLVNYYAGLQIGKTSNISRRKWLLAISISVSLGILFAFKYLNFFGDSVESFLDKISIEWDMPLFDVLLPIGISFYTFQALSYTIDVYRGKKDPEHHLGIFALYVSFFPQLVAGPIERAGRLLPQFRTEHKFEYNRVTSGMKLVAWGLFKKVVIADTVAIVVDQVYSNPESFDGTHLILATVLFALQIYCDFSGYSDIAIGTARIMGFELMTNFREPYLASSVPEFWRRWHISLSTWFRDYLYIPIGGNRVVKWRWQFNLLFVFLVSGLWHGADFTFIIWGGLHGLYLVIAMWTGSIREKLYSITRLDHIPVLLHMLKVLTVFTLVCFAWIFFRADNTSDAFYVITHLHTGLGALFSNIFDISTVYNSILDGFGFSPTEWLTLLVSIGFLGLFDIIQYRGNAGRLLAAQPFAIRWAAYYALVIWILLYGQFGAEEFIYFQF